MNTLTEQIEMLVEGGARASEELDNANPRSGLWLRTWTDSVDWVGLECGTGNRQETSSDAALRPMLPCSL